MKKIAVLLAIFIIVFVTSCPTQPPIKDWTIMVWLDADNNLDQNGLIDFNEMEYGLYRAQVGDPSVTNKLSVVVQFDRSGSNNTARYLIQPDARNANLDTTIVSTRLDFPPIPEANMGDAHQLKDFIDYCKSKFPAHNYMLEFWNHGAGVRSIAPRTGNSNVKSVCIDETSNDWLYTGEISDVLTSAESVNVIGYDACLMSMLEIGYQYRPGVTGKFSADYMVASPPQEWGDGWEYYKIFERFKGSGTDAEGDLCYDVSSLTGEQLASLIVKEHKDALVGHYSSDPVTAQALTAFDLSKTENVKSALDALSTKLQNKKSEVISNIQMNGSTTRAMAYFNFYNADQWKDDPSFDLYDFAQRISLDTTDFDLDTRTDASNLMTAIESCIVTSWGDTGAYTGFTPGKNGLAFFFPGDGQYLGVPYFYYEWWYTSFDTAAWWHAYNPSETDIYYGKLDFCTPGTVTGTVENWWELLKAWYDPTNAHTPGSW